MCVAIHVPPGAKVKHETLQDCERSNEDGAGVAWAEHGAVHWIKGLDYTGVADLLRDLPLDSHKLVHFRVATVGEPCIELCHPFTIEKKPSLEATGRAKEVLIHNGHWGNWDTVQHLTGRLPAGPWSDTRMMARILHMFDRAKVIEALSKAGQKLALLHRANVVERHGVWQMFEGAWFSNMAWQVSNWRPGPHYHGGWKDKPGYSFLDKWDDYGLLP